MSKELENKIKNKLKKIHEKKIKEEKEKFYKELKKEGMKIIESSYLSNISIKISNINETTNRNNLNTTMKEIRKNINQLIVEEDNEKIDRIVLEFDKLVEEMKKKLKEMEIAEKNLVDDDDDDEKNMENYYNDLVI